MTRVSEVDASGTVRAPLGLGRGVEGVRERFASLVCVVVVPPHICLSLRVALGRVLPLLLAPERGEVEVAPGGAERFVAALVDEIGAENLVALTNEDIVAVPFVDAEVTVPVIGDGVPRD